MTNEKDKTWVVITDFLTGFTKIIALVVCMILIGASGIIMFNSFFHLMNLDPQSAIVNALYVAVILELFYVIKSFITRGNMNVGAIINVGIIAAVKELIFLMESLTIQIAIAFATVLLSLGILYVLELIHYKKKAD